MTDDLIEDLDEGREIQEIHRENSNGHPSKKAWIKQILANKRRLIMVLSGGLFLVLIALAGLFFFSGSDKDAAPEKVQISDQDLKTSMENPPELVFEDIVVLETFERIPLKTGSSMQYISLGISLELTDHRYRKMVVTVEDRIRKIVQGQVREMTWLELRNPEGKLKLKYELLSRMNSLFPKVTIRNIYFSTFLMQ